MFASVISASMGRYIDLSMLPCLSDALKSGANHPQNNLFKRIEHLQLANHQIRFIQIVRL